MPSSICARDACPVMCGGTTRPRRSTKNVSGTAVTPHFGHVLPSASLTFVYVTSYRFRYACAGPLRSCALTPRKTTSLRFAVHAREAAATSRASSLQG